MTTLPQPLTIPQVPHGCTLLEAQTDIDAIAVWLNELAMIPNTYISNRQSVERFYLWLLYIGKDLKKISREIVQQYVAFLEDPQPADKWCGPAVGKYFTDGSVNPKWRPFIKGLSERSINLNLSQLAKFYDYLAKGGYLSSLNPFRLVARKIVPEIKANSLEECFITKEEFQMYIMTYIETMPKGTNKELMEYHRAKWIFTFLFLTGCRRSEFVQSRMSDFICQEDKWWFKVLGKGQVIQIPVTDELFNALKEYRIASNLDPEPKLDETEIALAFSIKTGKNITTDKNIYEIVKKVCSSLADELGSKDHNLAIKFSRFSTDWLRNSSAVAQISDGLSIQTVRKNQRHGTIETTLRYDRSQANAQHLETSEKFKLN